MPPFRHDNEPVKPVPAAPAVPIRSEDGEDGAEIARLTHGLLCLQLLKKHGLAAPSQCRELKQMLLEQCAPLEVNRLFSFIFEVGLTHLLHQAAVKVYGEDRDLEEFAHTCYVLLRCPAPSAPLLVPPPSPAAVSVSTSASAGTTATGFWFPGGVRLTWCVFESPP